MNTSIVGVGELKPTPTLKPVHDDKYNVDVYEAARTSTELGTSVPLPGREPVLDILVPTHARVDLTMSCVRALYMFTQTPFHLIILDDAPVDDYGLTEKYIKELQKERNNITYCHSNIHWRSGNTFFNVGIKYARTEYVATIMNSVAVEPAWEIVALQLMGQDKQVGIIGFKCLFPNGLIESAGIAFAGAIPTDIGRDEPGYRHSEVRDAEAVQWAFALHRKKALEGNLEEDTFNGHVGWDDIDNCLVVKSKGWKIIYCGQGVGIHQPRSTRGSNSTDAFLRNQENSHTFFKRWGLWNKYLEGNKMNVGDILKSETKDVLTAAVTRIQVLQEVLRKEETAIQPLVNQAMKELGVDSGQYLLEMNPQRNVWVLKPNPQAILPAAPPAEAKKASDTESGNLQKTVEEVKV